MSVEATATEEVKKAAADIKEALTKGFDNQDQKIQAIEAASADLVKRVDQMEKRNIHAEVNMDRFRFDGTAKSFRENVLAKKADPRTSGSGQIMEIQKLADEVMLMECIRDAASRTDKTVPRSIQHMNIWKEYGEALKHLGVEKTVGDDWQTTDTESADWIPIDMSQNLHEFIQMRLRVAALFQEFTLPTATYRWPFVTAAPAAEIASENRDPALYPSYTATEQLFGTLVPPADEKQFTAKKIRAFQFYTREFAEDTIRAVIPWLMRQLPLAMSRAWESAILNGDIAGGTLADNTTTVTSGWFDGLREYVVGQAGRVGDGTDPNEYQFQEEMGGTWNVGVFHTHLRRQRKRMDKYGVDDNMDSLVYVVGLDAYFQMMNITGMQTLDDFGPNATLLTGQVGSFDSIPVVLSQFSNLSVEGQHATPGNNGKNAATMTRESKYLVLVNTEEWLRARRPGIAPEVVRFPHHDQYEVVAFERADFGMVGPTTALNVNFGYDIPEF
jgi:HK97 family phage major capsid protein